MKKINKWLVVLQKRENLKTPFARAKKKKIQKPKRILAPKSFCISNERHREKLTKFLGRVRKYVKNGQRILIDFSETQETVSDGTLLFYSEIKRLISIFPNSLKLITCNIPSSNKVRQVLSQIGLLKLLNNNFIIAPKRDDVINWHAAEGRKVDGERYHDFMGSYNGRITDALNEKFFNSVTEAMTNSINHAYIDDREDGIKLNDYTGWWMFSQEKEGTLSVLFCDLGVGIPRTLPITKPGYFNTLVQKLALTTSKDSKIIEHAIVYGSTRTDQENRGKGLTQIVDLINGMNDATIMIHSNKGFYSLSGGKEKSYDFNTSIMGTMIFWQVPISESANNANH